MMKGVIFQSAAVLILSTPNLLAAFGLTWTSYTGAILESPASPIGVTLTRSQVELVASLPLLGSLVSVCAWRIPDMLGRKNCEVLAGVFLTLTWSLIATSNSIAQLFLARFLLGFGVGLHMLSFLIYINEIAQASIRGTMACVPLFFFSFGTLISYTVGWFCSYYFIVYMNLVISVMFTVAVNFLKESPVFLLTRGKDKDALISLNFYRGTSKTTTAILEELEYLKSQREASPYEPAGKDELADNKEYKGEKEDKTVIAEMPAWKLLITSAAVRRALITITLFSILSTFMGMTAIQTFAGQIFRTAAPGISPHLCSVIMAMAIAGGNALAIFITDLVPRRVLMISSCTTCAVSLGALCSILRWAWAPMWAVPLCILMYSCANVVGAANLPMVQLSESFMPKVKTIVSAIFMSTLSLANFFTIFFLGPAVELVGMDGMFFFFCLVSLAAAVISYFIMKETRRVPLEEIQAMYERGFLYRK